MVYEVLFFNGWGTMPAYYLLDGVEGNTPEQALAANLERVIQQVREHFGFAEDEMSDARIQEAESVAPFPLAG